MERAAGAGLRLGWGGEVEGSVQTVFLNSHSECQKVTARKYHNGMRKR